MKHLNFGTCVNCEKNLQSGFSLLSTIIWRDSHLGRLGRGSLKAACFKANSTGYVSQNYFCLGPLLETGFYERFCINFHFP
jgi:hypothetical protein